MKKLIFFGMLSFFLCFTSISYAQNEEKIVIENLRVGDNNTQRMKKQYLDSVFVNGVVVHKNGSKVHVQMNYSHLLNGICYIDNNKIYKLKGLDEIDYICYGSRRFLVDAKYKLIESLVTYSDSIGLYVKRNSIIKNRGESNGAYGTDTETSSVDRYSSILDEGQLRNLEIDNTIEVTVKYFFLIKKGKITVKISKVKDLVKAFPEKRDIIIGYVSQLKNKDLSETSIKELFRCFFSK